jgi:hypothetical protein
MRLILHLFKDHIKGRLFQDSVELRCCNLQHLKDHFEFINKCKEKKEKPLVHTNIRYNFSVMT